MKNLRSIVKRIDNNETHTHFFSAGMNQHDRDRTDYMLKETMTWLIFIYIPAVL